MSNIPVENFLPKRWGITLRKLPSEGGKSQDTSDPSKSRHTGKHQGVECFLIFFFFKESTNTIQYDSLYKYYRSGQVPERPNSLKQVIGRLFISTSQSRFLVCPYMGFFPVFKHLKMFFPVFQQTVCDNSSLYSQIIPNLFDFFFLQIKSGKQIHFKIFF